MNWLEFHTALARHDMTQAEFARLTGFAEHTVSLWQHRKRGVPEWVRSWLANYRRRRNLGHAPKLPGHGTE